MFLTEAAFQLTIAAAGMAVMIHNTNNLVDDALAMGTGQYMANVASAVNTYVFDNMTVLAGSPSGPTTIAAGSVTAAVANPLHPTVQDLINLKLLPIGFSDISPLGLAFRVDLTPTNCSTGLTNCTIPGAMYSTTAYRDASGRVRTDQLASVIATAGVDSGVSYAESPGVITGMAASWSAPNPLAGSQPGVLMMRVGNTSLLAQSMNQFYKRDGSLNLTGPLDANNQTMNRVGNLQSNGSVSVAGDVAAAGNVNGNGVYGNYVRSNGDLSAGGNVAGNGVYGNYVQSNGDVNVLGNQYVQQSLVARGMVYLPALAWAGYGCGGNGITTDPNGGLLACKAGVWHPAGGGIKSYADFDWHAGYGSFGTGLPYNNWSCALTQVGGKYAGGGENIQVIRDGGSGTWVVVGSSSSDNSGAFARISCAEF
ncbi:adhesin [Cupriavidus necator]|uniref:adhesin n=1 Tax=Cupriavidus necator TaxID=106590 RepID=UPI0019D2102A|nr:adhesin [Cupriavidus necator]